MPRKTDNDRDYNPQAELEAFVAAMADALGPSFENGLSARSAATLARLRARRRPADD
jgi:hypothetical protein